MKRHLLKVLVFMLLFIPCCGYGQNTGTTLPRVLFFFGLNVEADHALFAVDALKFFTELADKDGFQLDATTNWADLNEEHLRQYKAVVWLNGFPGDATQRKVFEHYMENGGAWMGFHVAAYNDKNTHWPWFMSFIGEGVFAGNTWPPVSAKVIVDDTESPVTRGLPKTFIAPINEWYKWNPSPRLDKDIHVLLTLDPANYPLGIKGLLTEGDIPIVWTNTKYKMIYMNMGHGDKIFISPVQNRLIENAMQWLLAK